jgi:hypothetical protein
VPAIGEGAPAHGSPDALIRQAERDQLADAVVGDVPADRAGTFRQVLHGSGVGQRVDLQAAQRTWDDHPVEAGGTQLLDQDGRQALLAFDLLPVLADHRAQIGGGPHQRLRFNVRR